MSGWLRDRLRPLLGVRGPLYRATVAALGPANHVLVRLRRGAAAPRSALHVSYSVHIPARTVELLREQGYRADYLAVGEGPASDRADFVLRPGRVAPLRALQEFWWLWTVVARYEVLHLHFMITPTATGWELPLLERMGRRIVVHWRGCEVRDRERNMALHPDVNICQECDYGARICRDPINLLRRRLAGRHGHLALVTTPDMLDFAPGARHLPLFAPRDAELPPRPPRPAGAPLRIAHATNHPGIEGTARIRAAVEALRRRGHALELEVVTSAAPGEVLARFAAADLTVGKLKMGYYANAQIESLALGVPAVTWVRPDLRVPELEGSGLILTTLADLERTLEHYLLHPEALAEASRQARAGSARLHDGREMARRLAALYDQLLGR